MSRTPKYDSYFNELKNVGDSIIVPAETMVKLSNHVWHYQRSEKRNKKGLYLSCESIMNHKEKEYEFTVRVIGTGRWDDAPKVEIKLLSFDKEIDVANFQVTRDRVDFFTCNACVDLDSFVIGEQVIKPHSWFDLEEVRTEKPDWFKRNELFLLNDVFEENFRKFL